MKAINLAIDGLVYPKQGPPRQGRSNSTTFGHVFLLTSQIDSLQGSELAHASVQIHVICSGCPLQDRWNAVKCNGWKVHNPFPIDLSCPTMSKLEGEGLHLRRKLQSCLQQGRSGISSATLTDVRLNILPERQCQIEGVTGDLQWRELHCGETRSTVVTLRVLDGPEVPTNHDSQKFPSQISTGSDQLLLDLEKMLGLTDTLVSTISAGFKNPSMPSDTTCRCHQQFRLRILNPNYEGCQSGSPQTLFPNRETCKTTQEALALHYASHCSPSEALIILEKEFKYAWPSCPRTPFFEHLVRELKYQARLADRLAIQNSPRKLDSNLGSRCDEVAITGPRLEVGPIQPLKDLDRIRSPGIERRRSENRRPLQLAEQLGFDDAQRIWNDIRNASTSSHQLGGERRVRSGNDFDTRRKVQQVASRNTARSFTAPLGLSRQ